MAELTPTCPFLVRSRVRVASPANPGHPRLGREGEVMAARWFVPTPGRDGGRWMLRVRFGPKATWDDWRQHGRIGDEWLLFADELEAARDRD